MISDFRNQWAECSGSDRIREFRSGGKWDMPNLPYF